MALKFLTALDVQSTIDLNQNQITNIAVHSGDTDPSSPVTGQLFYNTLNDQLKYYDGGWNVLSTSTGSITNITIGTSTTTVTVQSSDGTDGVISTASSTQAGVLSSSLFDKLTGIEASADVTDATNVASAGAIMDGDFTSNGLMKRTGAGTYGTAVADTDYQSVLSEGAFVDGDKTKLDGIASSANNYTHPDHTGDVTSSGDGATTIANNAVTHGKYQQVAANTIIGNNAGTTGNVSALSKTNVLSLLNVEDGADVTDSANVKSALNATLSDLTLGANTDTITIPGDLVVSGTQTIQNETISVIENNTIQFEGTTANDFETKLTAIDPTADRTISLPNLSGNVALFSNAPTTTITSTPAELNILDGVTATATELNILDGVTATTAEINKLDGVTATTAELNLLDGITTLSGSNTGDEPDATTATKGVVELATSAESIAGTDTVRAVRPQGLKAAIDARTSAFNIGDGTNTSYTITHNFATRDVIIQLFDNSTYDTVYADVVRTTTNTATITFASAPSTNDVRVLVHQIL